MSNLLGVGGGHGNNVLQDLPQLQRNAQHQACPSHSSLGLVMDRGMSTKALHHFAQSETALMDSICSKSPHGFGCGSGGVGTAV